MKKPSRAQTINDFPPLAFDSPLEPVPLLQAGSPSLEPEQKEVAGGTTVTITCMVSPIVSSGRKASRDPNPKEKAKLRNFFAEMLAMRALKAHLPPSVRVECAQNGDIRVSNQLELRADGESPVRVEQQNSTLCFLAKTFLKEICFAEMYYWAYQREKDEALRALDAEDPDPELFLKILTYYGWLAVMEDPRLWVVYFKWQERFIDTGNPRLREALEKVQDELFWVGPGRPDLLPNLSEWL